jgi:hypothetical protein
MENHENQLGHQPRFKPSTVGSHNIGLDIRWPLSSRFLTTRILSLNKHPWRYFRARFLSVQIVSERKYLQRSMIAYSKADVTNDGINIIFAKKLAKATKLHCFGLPKQRNAELLNTYEPVLLCCINAGPYAYRRRKYEENFVPVLWMMLISLCVHEKYDSYLSRNINNFINIRRYSPLQNIHPDSSRSIETNSVKPIPRALSSETLP